MTTKISLFVSILALSGCGAPDSFEGLSSPTSQNGLGEREGAGALCNPNNKFKEYTTHDYAVSQSNPLKPIQIWKPIQLYRIGLNQQGMKANILQCADLDFSTFYNSDQRQFSLGDELTLTFEGRYDGNKKKISNFKIDKDSPYYKEMGWPMKGLFSWIVGGEVKNLILEKPYINIANDSSAGPLAGFCSMGGAISHVSVRGASVENNGTAGGLLGLSNCIVSYAESLAGSVVGSWEVGGLIGQVFGPASVSYAKSDNYVKAIEKSSDTGGLVGTLSPLGVIDHSLATGEVDAMRAGGLVGSIHGDARIEDSYAIASIHGTYTGGLVGSLLNANGSEPTLLRTYSSSSITSTSYAVNGSHIGFSDYGILQFEKVVTKSFSLTKVDGKFETAFTNNLNSNFELVDSYSYIDPSCVRASCDYGEHIDNVAYFSDTNNAPMNEWSIGSSSLGWQKNIGSTLEPYVIPAAGAQL